MIKKVLDGMCHLGVQVQGFGCPKLSTWKRSVLSILFRNLRFTRTNARYRFLEALSQAELTDSRQELTDSIENMNAKLKSLSYWLFKFVQEVANKFKLSGRYPFRTLYSIVFSLKRANFCCLRDTLLSS